MPFTPILTRQSGPADFQALSQIGGLTFYETFRPHNSEEDMQAYISKAYNEDTIAANLRNPDIYYAMAFHGPAVIGYIKLIWNASHPNLEGKVAELEKIYVRKSHWSTGAGFQLMQHAIEVSTHKGFAQLFLGVWNKNERAISFYRKAGFSVFAHRSFMLGTRLCNDDMMVLPL